MHELRKILVATDLEAGNETCVATAVRLARAFHARILLLHVMPEILSERWSDDVSPEVVGTLLNDLKSDIEAGGAVVEDVAVLWGRASYRICQYAEKKDAHLTVIGASQGRKPDVRLGVTAGRVLRNSIKPVWLAAKAEFGPPTSILCPVDGSPAAIRALDSAVLIARHFGARLTVLKVLESMPTIYAQLLPSDESSSGAEIEELRSSLDALVRDCDHAGIKLETQIREGAVHSEILSAAAEFGCDLVVMGAEGTSNHLRSLIGSVTQKVTREMPCSVLVVNDEDILSKRLRSAIDSIRRHMCEGASLLRAGHPTESLVEYEQCLFTEPTYRRAWEGMADAYETLGDLNKADRCRDAARWIREAI